ERLEVLVEARLAGVVAHAAQDAFEPLPDQLDREPVVNELLAEEPVLHERPDRLEPAGHGRDVRELLAAGWEALLELPVVADERVAPDEAVRLGQAQLGAHAHELRHEVRVVARRLSHSTPPSDDGTEPILRRSTGTLTRWERCSEPVSPPATRRPRRRASRFSKTAEARPTRQWPPAWPPASPRRS